MAARLAGLSLLWFTGAAWSQAPNNPPVPTRTADGTITYIKEANSTVPVLKNSAPIPSVAEPSAPATLPPPIDRDQAMPPLPAPTIAPAPSRSVLSTEAPKPVAMPSMGTITFPPPSPAIQTTSGFTPAKSVVQPAPATAAMPMPTPPASSMYVPTLNQGTPPMPRTQQVARQPGIRANRPEPRLPLDEPVEAEDQSSTPGPQVLFKLESERDWMERVRQENRSKSAMERVVFPEEPPVSNEKYAQRAWKPHRMEVEPSYVCYGRLYFEDKNTERYGWDLGPLQPLVSSAGFCWDTVIMPYNAFSDPFHRVETSAGHCLQGDPVPLLLYPPKWSLAGLAGEAAVVTPLWYVLH